MMKPTLTQLQKRYEESLASLFNQGNKTKKLLFLKSSSDVGVMRNGGRNGSRYAPQSILANFKKFSSTKQASEIDFYEFEVASQSEESLDFPLAQFNQSEKIKSIFEKNPGASICHLGGGHDHIYPLLKAISPNFKRIVVLNIDAHADTRNDETPHSGTPFRQFADEYPGEFHLFELGLNPFANSFSTLAPLNHGASHFLWRGEVGDNSKLDVFFNQISSLMNKETFIIFSLDADALNGHEMPGVSAINPNGLSQEMLSQIWHRFSLLNLNHPSILGIYELNPVYDTLSMQSSKKMAAFIFEAFIQK
jgi:formiminoglutamase